MTLPYGTKVGRIRKFEIYWFTVSYKQLLFWILAILLVAALGGFTFFKEYALRKYNQIIVEADNAFKAGNPLKNGRFVSIVGTVKVKKSYAVQWSSADLQTVLEAGDYIQTSSDSFARIIFPEGTSYLMKPDSLIVVQENSEDPQTSAKKVSVRVTSGSIDLSTARREVSTSTSMVSAASATAMVNQETKLAVESNPALRTAQFLVHKGSARVSQGAESYQVGPFESVTAGETKLVKEKVIAPPELLTPNNVKPVIAREGLASKIEFTWSPTPGAVAYKIRISDSSAFSNILREEVVKQKTRYVTSGLEEGTYYWTVSSIDGRSKSSRESDPNKFTFINKSSDERGSDLFLSVDQVLRISNIFEIIGRTDPGATVVVNDEPVPLMGADGTFKHFTSPLPHKGKNIITITAQDRSGNSKTLKREVYID